MATRSAAPMLEAPRPKRTKARCKSPLASENFVDIFNLLPRWQLDPVDISCPQFRYIVSTMKDTACLRTFESIRFISTSPAGPIRVNWQFAENIEKEDLSITFSEMDEALGDTKKRILSSAIGCFQFWDLYFADEMLVKIVEAMGSVRVGKVEVVEEAGEVHVGPLDAGILALLFREVGAGVEVTFRQAWYLEAIISDEFSKRLLEKAHQYAGANNVKLIVACNIEQQMSHLADFQQFRRAVAASDRSPAKTINDLPANGRRTFSLTFSEGFRMSPRELCFETGLGADQ